MNAREIKRFYEIAAAIEKRSGHVVDFELHEVEDNGGLASNLQQAMVGSKPTYPVVEVTVALGPLEDEDDAQR